MITWLKKRREINQKDFRIHWLYYLAKGRKRTFVKRRLKKKQMKGEWFKRIKLGI